MGSGTEWPGPGARRPITGGPSGKAKFFGPGRANPARADFCTRAEKSTGGGATPPCHSDLEELKSSLSGLPLKHGTNFVAFETSFLVLIRHGLSCRVKKDKVVTFA